MSFPVTKQKSAKLPPIPTTMKRGKLTLLHQTSSARPLLYNTSKSPKPTGEGSYHVPGRFEYPSSSDSRKSSSSSLSSNKLYRPVGKYEDYSKQCSLTDEDLLLLMNQELQRTDSRLERLKQQLISSEEKHGYKDAQIAALHDKISSLEEQLAKETQKKVCPCNVTGLTYEQLLTKHTALEKQLSEMQEFLADYDLTWVGGKKPGSKKEEETTSSFTNEETMWSPAKSYSAPCEELKVNFEELMQSIKDLNMVAGEGETQLCYTSSGATFKRTIQSIPLTLYSNGLLLSGGPFRSFSDPATWLILRDILDGYFPHELQKDYPDGVVFQVTDKRDTPYADPKTEWHAFCGKGYRLGHKTSHTHTDLPTSKY